MEHVCVPECRPDAHIARPAAVPEAEDGREVPCLHCGRLPEADGDHTCPCPWSDADCPNHPVHFPGLGTVTACGSLATSTATSILREEVTCIHCLAAQIDPNCPGFAAPTVPVVAQPEAEDGQEDYRAPKMTQEQATTAMRVVREHEPRSFGCACGAPIGDDIDYRNHLVNRAILAVPARDDERERLAAVAALGEVAAAIEAERQESLDPHWRMGMSRAAALVRAAALPEGQEGDG